MSQRDAQYCAADDPALMETDVVSSDVGDDGLILEDPPFKREFAISTEGDANWLVRSITEARRYREHVEAWAAAEVRRAERRERFLLERYGAQLQGWIEKRLMADGNRRRSVSLPAGVVGVRATRAQVVVTDPEAVMAWARSQMPQLVQIKVTASGEAAARMLAWQATEKIAAKVEATVAKSGLNKHVAETGELPAGVALQPSVDELFVR